MSRNHYHPRLADKESRRRSNWFRDKRLVYARTKTLNPGSLTSEPKLFISLTLGTGSIAELPTPELWINGSSTHLSDDPKFGAFLRTSHEASTLHSPLLSHVCPEACLSGWVLLETGCDIVLRCAKKAQLHWRQKRIKAGGWFHPGTR